MATFVSPSILALSLGTTLMPPALAQTARVAHLSHGGSLATLAEAEALDNFGLAPAFEADSVVRISDTTAIGYGQYAGRAKRQPAATKTIRYASRTQPKSQAAKVQQLQQRYPAAKLVGFDSIPKPALPPPAPVQEKQKPRRKQPEGATTYATPPAPPRHPGVLVGVAVIVALGGLGWLLGERTRPKLARAAG